MTETEVLALEPRELDALVAEVVFGFEVYWREFAGALHPHTEDPQPDNEWCPECGYDGHWDATLVRHYSTTWTGLGLVVERMRDLGWDYTIETRWDGMQGRKLVSAVFGRPGDAGEDIWIAMAAWAAEAPEAVSLAALRALGVIE